MSTVLLKKEQPLTQICTGMAPKNVVKLPCVRICRIELEEACLQRARPPSQIKCETTQGHEDSSSVLRRPKASDPPPSETSRSFKTEDESKSRQIIMNTVSLPILKLHRLRVDQHLPCTLNKHFNKGKIQSTVGKPKRRQTRTISARDARSGNFKVKWLEEYSVQNSHQESYGTILGLKAKQEEDEVAINEFEISDYNILHVKTEASESQVDLCGKSFVANLNAGSPYGEIGKRDKTYNVHSRWRQHKQPSADPESDWWPRKQRVRRFPCDQCGQKFFTAVQRSFHMRIHTQYRPFSCETCGKTFSRKGGLQEHLPVHGTELPFACSICRRGFKFKTNLTRHMRFHSDVRPYVCEVCGKGFKITDHLKDHMRSHSGNRSFFCTVCGQGFQRKYNLVHHQRIHTGERPFHCSECGKTFRRQQTLSMHIKVHSKEKLYACEICGEKFIQSGQLKVHKRRKHKGTRQASQ